MPARLSLILGFSAVLLASLNVVSGYLITDRMLKMFREQETGQRNEQRRLNDTILPILYMLAAAGFIAGHQVRLNISHGSPLRSGSGRDRHAAGRGRHPAAVDVVGYQWILIAFFLVRPSNT